MMPRVYSDAGLPLLILRAAAAVCIHAVGVPVAHAQDDIPTFTVDTREVDLHVSVLDKSSKLITGIPRTAFKVFENNVEQPIKAFSHGRCAGFLGHRDRQQRQHARQESQR